ncbi:hypothetical protein [Pectobacterium versatile]|uniref:hypothetical protein n=1 Tax=Pectobacterium versatile TaxID=2488639 RepID=UPI001CE16BDA|nr:MULTISPECIES: hypothetical protein [Pectobacterium]MCA5931843.1 hypothetical protein [Pectobacterium versatile]MCA5950647.1 hypothetical protein [Pectobacterium versatile]MCA5953310.1 hypothetical protein [Pectobacterium versatile]UCP85284.1 hypothetical protein LGL96_18185 [Pectobacterium versatile]
MLSEGKTLNYADSKNDTYILSKELKKYLLCPDCEYKLKINGEDYFAEKCLSPVNKPDVAELLKIAKSKLIPIWNAGGRLAPQISIGPGFASEIEMNDLYYFAISIFWRGTFEWGSNYKPIEINEHTKEEMRLYLFDKEKNPLNYRVDIVPAFWTPRFSVIFPTRKKGKDNFLFSIFSFDFHIDLTRPVTRFSNHTPVALLASPSLDVKMHNAFARKHEAAVERGKIDKNITWLRKEN